MDKMQIPYSFVVQLMILGLILNVNIDCIELFHGMVKVIQNEIQ